MRNKLFALFYILSIPFFSACTQDDTPRTAAFFAMDTYMNFTVYGDQALLDEAELIITDLETRISTTDPGSEIYRINHTGAGAVSPETASLLKTALSMCDLTGGILDISIFPVVRTWGFTTGEYRIPTPEERAALLERVDYRQVHLDGDQVSLPEGMEIDLGSVAKGYAGRQAAAYLRQSGVSSALLNLGGNVQTVGCKPDGSPWRVAIQDPMSDDALAGVLEIVDLAAVTSGGYQRYFTGNDGTVYWHIMDPTTGAPAESGLISVTVVAADGAYCDALSTSLFIMGEERAIAFWKERLDFEMVLITREGQILLTPGLTFTPDENSPYTIMQITEE